MRDKFKLYKPDSLVLLSFACFLVYNIATGLQADDKVLWLCGTLLPTGIAWFALFIIYIQLRKEVK